MDQATECIKTAMKYVAEVGSEMEKADAVDDERYHFAYLTGQAYIDFIEEIKNLV